MNVLPKLSAKKGLTLGQDTGPYHEKNNAIKYKKPEKFTYFTVLAKTEGSHSQSVFTFSTAVTIYRRNGTKTRKCTYRFSYGFQ
jgi:hypothetical protein